MPGWNISLYDELQHWQSGLAALIGFGALIVAALWNFKLNRRRDKEIRREEASAVASALYGEILLLQSELADSAKAIARARIVGHELMSRDLPFLKPGEPMLYEALADKVGILSPALLIPITGFYSGLEKAKRNLHLSLDPTGPQYSPLIVLDPAIDAIKAVEPALRRIEAMLKIPRAIDPETGNTEDVITEERASMKAQLASLDEAPAS